MDGTPDAGCQSVSGHQDYLPGKARLDGLPHMKITWPDLETGGSLPAVSVNPGSQPTGACVSWSGSHHVKSVPNLDLQGRVH
jgi:hypothetical protein